MSRVPNGERVDRLGLDPLESRKERGDEIEIWKILKGADHVDVENMVPFVGESRTDGHCLKVRVNPFEVVRNISFL